MFSQVEVYYVDYGNKAEISIKQLLKIPDEFMKLPYQVGGYQAIFV